MDLIVTILAAVTKDLPISPRSTPYNFYRDASSALLQLVNQWLNFTYSRSHAFRYEKKEHKSYFGKNRTHDFRTSRCADYLLDHSAGQYDKKSGERGGDSNYLSPDCSPHDRGADDTLERRASLYPLAGHHRLGRATHATHGNTVGIFKQLPVAINF